MNFTLSIDAQLYILTGGLVILIGIAAIQAFLLKNIYKSKSSTFGAFVFVLFGLRQLYTFFRLKSNIALARQQGVMVDHLNLEQWIVVVLWPYLIAIGFVIWLQWRRNDLKKLGI